LIHGLQPTQSGFKIEFLSSVKNQGVSITQIIKITLITVYEPDPKSARCVYPTDVPHLLWGKKYLVLALPQKITPFSFS
jgi:hypothetical protein